jgi:hypothetical protein
MNVVVELLSQRVFVNVVSMFDNIKLFYRDDVLFKIIFESLPKISRTQEEIDIKKFVNVLDVEILYYKSRMCVQGAWDCKKNNLHDCHDILTSCYLGFQKIYIAMNNLFFLGFEKDCERLCQKLFFCVKPTMWNKQNILGHCNLWQFLIVNGSLFQWISLCIIFRPVTFLIAF